MTEKIDVTTSSLASLALTSAVSVPPPTMPHGKFKWRGGSSIKQTFSLSDTIIYYIAKNPSSEKGYLKMAQSCKFFFDKNPILIASRIHEGFVFPNICSKTRKECKNNNGKCCSAFDIKKHSSKIWLTEELYLDKNTDTNYTSMLCPKIYRSEINRLELYHRTVLLDDFKVLASSVTILAIQNVKIINSDGIVVPIDEIFEFVPNLKYLYFTFYPDASAIKSFSNFNNLVHLEAFGLIDTPEICNAHDISKYMKDHKDMMIGLCFDDTISEDYANQLDALIDTVIESEITDQIIRYEGQDEDKLEIMENHMDRIIKLFSDLD